MPLFLALFALFAPRLVIVLLWLLTTWFNGIFNTVLIPLVGFIFLPTTLLWYTAVQHWFNGQWTFLPILGTIFAVLIDLSPVTHRRR